MSQIIKEQYNEQINNIIDKINKISNISYSNKTNTKLLSVYNKYENILLRNILTNKLKQIIDISIWNYNQFKISNQIDTTMQKADNLKNQKIALDKVITLINITHENSINKIRSISLNNINNRISKVNNNLILINKLLQLLNIINTLNTQKKHLQDIEEQISNIPICPSCNRPL